MSVKPCYRRATTSSKASSFVGDFEGEGPRRDRLYLSRGQSRAAVVQDSTSEKHFPLLPYLKVVGDENIAVPAAKTEPRGRREDAGIGRSNAVSASSSLPPPTPKQIKKAENAQSRFN